MPRKPGLNSEFVMFDVIYEDGMRRSNCKVCRTARLRRSGAFLPRQSKACSVQARRRSSAYATAEWQVFVFTSMVWLGAGLRRASTGVQAGLARDRACRVPPLHPGGC